GRNEQRAEDAVRKSVSARVDEALAQNVVDLQANDGPDLAAKMDGRTAKTAAGDVVLATKAAPIEDDALNPIESLLHFVVDPQIAVLLFTLGTYGLIFELSNPGLIFPGIVGVIAIFLALFAFGTLDANGAGIAFMVFAIVLFALEIKLPAHGLLTVGGIVSLLLGLVILFPPFRPTFPGVRATVDPAIIAVVVAVTAGFFVFLVRMAARLLRQPGLVALILVVIAIIILRAIIHIVPQFQRLVVFSFGRFQGMYGPGLVIIAPPPIQTVAQTIDLREFVVEIPQQTCITQDNAPISIDFLIYQRVIEEQAKDSFLNIQNFRQAIQGIAQTTLRAVIGN